MKYSPVKWALKNDSEALQCIIYQLSCLIYPVYGNFSILTNEGGIGVSSNLPTLRVREVIKICYTFWRMKTNLIDEVITSGVAHIFPSREDFKKVLQSGKKLTVYNGIDPTAPSLHLGHLVVLRKLKEFQRLGHQVILLVGDFTAMIGDPSGKAAARKPMTKSEVLKNAKNYKSQAGKILNFSGKNPAEMKFNSTWLEKLNLLRILNIASSFTAQQLLERDMFQKRIEKGLPIFLPEFIYPLLQGYDSVVMNVDVEIGGSDQVFNMLVGREMVKRHLGKEKFVLGTKLLTVGEVKMGKTESVFIPLSSSATEMFAKIMALSDEVLPSFFELLSDLDFLKLPKQKPMEVKKLLAKEILGQLFSKDEVEKAKVEFEEVFQKGMEPKEAPSLNLSSFQSPPTVSEALLKGNVVSSKSEVRRLVIQGAIEDEKGKIISPNEKVRVGVYKIGKYRFLKVKP